MYTAQLATTVLAMACLGAAAPLDEVRDPAAAAAFAEVFARLDAVEASALSGRGALRRKRARQT